MASDLLMQKVGPEGGQLSAEHLKGRLYSSLLESGVIDNLKTQLRTQILRQLRSVDSSVLDASASAEPPALPQRILNSLFIDYLTSQGYVYTLSVFTPECGMVSQVPFTRGELLHLLHLNDPASVLSRGKFQESQKSLAWELLERVDKLRGPSTTTESGSQTWNGQGGDFLELHLRSIEDQYLQKMDTEKLLPYHSLEERMDQYRREVDQRARAEIAAAVDRVRQFELGAARMEEATRYRRQLEDAREDLERVHAERLEQLRRREESQRERLQRQERAAETAAHEQRQRILAETEAMREREGKLKQLEEMQLKTLKLHEERLLEKALAVKEREEDVQRLRTLLTSQAEEHARMRRREVEREYETLISSAKKDRELLDVERTRVAEERGAVADELTAGRESRAQVRQLERALALAQEQLQGSADAVKDLETRIAKSGEEKRALQAMLGRNAGLETGVGWSHAGPFASVSACGHGPLIEKLQILRAADRKAKKKAVKELENLQATFQKQVREWREQQAEWRLVERQTQARIARLQAEAAAAADGQEQATRRAEELALRLRAAEREAADVTQLYKEGKAALQNEQLARHGTTAIEPLLTSALNHNFQHKLLDNLPRDTTRPTRPPSPMPGGDTPRGLPRELSPPSPAGTRAPGSVFPVPVIGPQTAAFSGALSRLNELQREEQHMQIALDDFRARVRAGRAETARAVERAARAPEAFRTIVRREITESSESSSSESTSGGVGNAFERTAQAERRQQTGREGSGEDTEEEGFLQRVEPVEGADTSGNRRKEREVPRRELRASEQELEGSAGGLNSDPKVAGRLSIGISKQPEVQKAEETFVQVEEERKGLAGDTGKVQEEESRPEGEAETPNEGKAPVSQTGAENMETREKGTPGVSKSATAKEEPPRSGQMVTPEKVHMEKVPTQSQQEGRVAEASSGGGEEVQSPASVKTRQGGGKDWTDDLLGMDGGLAPVKTVVTNGRDSMPDDVKSPDTVKVLVRRKENPLARESLEADVSLEREPGDKAESAAASEKEPGDPLFGSSGPMEAAEADQRRADLPLSTFGQALEPPVQFFPVKRDVEGADANKQVPLGGAVPLGGVVPLGGSVPLGGVVPLGGLVPLGGSVPPGRKEKAGGSAQRRRSGGGVTILEEVAKLAEREAPNAESRTTTPRDATNPRPPVENIDGPPKSDGFEAREVEGRLGELQKKAGVDAASKGARGRQAGERDDGDVQSETGSVSPVEVTHRGVPAWPSVVETGHRIKKASEGGQADQMSASGEDFVAGTVESAVFQVGHPDKVPDQSVSAERRPVDYAKVTARTGQVEPVGFTVDQFGLHEATAVAAATEQPAPLDPEDMPKVEEGTAIEPVKVSIWEKLQETVRESVPESVRESVLEGDPKQQAAGSVVASLAAEEVAEELDIDYDDAAYSEGGLSNLSIPAADGQFLQGEHSGSDGW